MIARGWAALGDEQGGVRVAQVVESGPGRHTCSLDRRLEVSLEPVRVAERPTLRALPHEVVLADAPRPGRRVHRSVIGGSAPSDAHRSSSPRSAAGRRPPKPTGDVHPSLASSCRSFFRSANEFACAQSGERCEPHEQPVLGVAVDAPLATPVARSVAAATSRGEFHDLLGLEEHHLGAVRPPNGDVVNRVRLQRTRSDGEPEDQPQDVANVPHGLGRHTARRSSATNVSTVG